MTGDLNFLLIGFLLQGALCGQFEVFMPQSIRALSGSCVTIPCSFDVEDTYNSGIDKTCRALWKYDEQTVVFDSSNPQSSAIQGELEGDLKRKDCTTTLNNMRPEHSNTYFLRVECKGFRQNFLGQKLHISVTDDPPTPTLTPSTLKVEEGTSVSLKCSAPAPCLSHPPTLTWTSSLGHIQESLQENQDRTKVNTSVLNFTASHLHHGKEIFCTAVYNKQHGSSQSATSGRLTLNVFFAPQILPLSHCIKTADQLSCSCETVGNPSPALQWHLDGSPVNHSDRFAISSEPLNDTRLRSIITVNQSQGGDLNLSCHSSNFLGSASQQLPVYSLKTTCAVCQDCSRQIAIACGITAAVVCALLVAIRAQCTVCHKPTKSECAGDTSRAVMSRGLSGEMENKVSVTSEEDIYVNTSMMRKSDKLETQLGHQHVANKSSEKQNEEGSDMLYASVVWKSKKKRKKKGDHSGSLYVEEERCMGEGMDRHFVSNALEMGSLYGNTVTGKNAKKATEYAQVTFRDKNMMHR